MEREHSLLISIWCGMSVWVQSQHLIGSMTTTAPLKREVRRRDRLGVQLVVGWPVS